MAFEQGASRSRGTAAYWELEPQAVVINPGEWRPQNGMGLCTHGQRRVDSEANRSRYFFEGPHVQAWQPREHQSRSLPRKQSVNEYDTAPPFFAGLDKGSE